MGRDSWLLFKLDLSADFFNLECISCWKQQRQNAVIFSYHVYWIYEFYETSIILQKACISINLTCYDWKPVPAQNSSQTIHYPSSRCRDKHYYYDKRKNLAYAFVLSFSFTIFAIILEISIWKRTKESSLEVTPQCIFAKRSYSRVLWMVSLNVTLQYITVFSPLFPTILYDYNTDEMP